MVPSSEQAAPSGPSGIGITRCQRGTCTANTWDDAGKAALFECYTVDRSMVQTASCIASGCSRNLFPTIADGRFWPQVS